MVKFIDNSVQEAMVRNRPSLSIIPPANKKLYLPRIAVNTSLSVVVVSFVGMFAYQFITGSLSYPLYNTRKEFQFKSDPYSGEVSCQYRDITYKQRNI